MNTHPLHAGDRVRFDCQGVMVQGKITDSLKTHTVIVETPNGEIYWCGAQSVTFVTCGQA